MWRTLARHQHNDPRHVTTTTTTTQRLFSRPCLPHPPPLCLILSYATASTLTKQYLYLQTPMLERAINGFNVVYTSCVAIRWHITGEKGMYFTMGLISKDGFGVFKSRSWDFSKESRWMSHMTWWQSGLYFPFIHILFCSSSCVCWIYVSVC